jgi:hypothetical protein
MYDLSQNYVADAFRTNLITVVPHYNGLVGAKGCPF